MANPIAEGFKAMADLANDEVLVTQLEKQVNQVLSGKKEGMESVLAHLYLETEKKVVAGSKGKLSEMEVRRNMRESFAGVEKEFPGFRLLFVSEPRQFITLGNQLILAYIREWERFFGKEIIRQAVGSALSETDWKDIKVSLEKGLVFNPIKMQLMGECVEIVAALLRNWHEKSRVLLGADISRRAFESAYRRTEDQYGFLPTIKSLLGATPLSVLGSEKTERLHELETKTTTQAKTIEATDKSLQRRGEELQQTVLELEETKKRLEITSQARSEFITVVSHQFRTPLSSIRWNSELLIDAIKEEEIDPKYKDAVEKMRYKSVYLIETLDRVFTALDIETEELKLDKKPAYLWELVQDVYNKKEMDIAMHDLKWKFNRKKEQVREMLVDKTKVATVINIILGNAIGYNKKGGKITVDLEPKEIDGQEFLVCAVKDDGIGMTETDKKKLFDKFFRAKSSVLKVADGTGLGMYIVKHVIEAHGGKVWVESAGPDKGTTVSFALPVAGRVDQE